MIARKVPFIVLVAASLIGASPVLAESSLTGIYSESDAVRSETLAQCLISVDLFNIGTTEIAQATAYFVASDNLDPASPWIGLLTLAPDDSVRLAEIVTVSIKEYELWQEGNAAPRLRLEYIGASGELQIKLVDLVSDDPGDGTD